MKHDRLNAQNELYLQLHDISCKLQSQRFQARIRVASIQRIKHHLNASGNYESGSYNTAQVGQQLKSDSGACW